MREVKTLSWHVEVDPDTFHYWGTATDLERQKTTCDEIAAAVKRHVDDVHAVRVVAERETVCSHCGSPWTERSDTYNGGCCDEDTRGDPDA